MSKSEVSLEEQIVTLENLISYAEFEWGEQTTKTMKAALETLRRVKLNTPYFAGFLWPFELDSVEEAGYEFANGKTLDYQKIWWEILKERIQNNSFDEKERKTP